MSQSAIIAMMGRSRPPAVDPDFASVVLLMHMDDAGLTDVKGHPVTLNGGAARVSDRSKFGGFSGFTDGVNDYISLPASADWNLGSGDFTIEFWQSRGSNGVTLATRPYNTAVNGSWVLQCSATSAEFSAFGLNSGSPSALCNFADAGIGWTHIAAVRNGTEFAVYANGVKGATTFTSAGSIAYASEPLIINSLYVGALAHYNAWIDELRITKGVARYTANFTPPAAAFPNS